MSVNMQANVRIKLKQIAAINVLCYTITNIYYTIYKGFYLCVEIYLTAIVGKREWRSNEQRNQIQGIASVISVVIRVIIGANQIYQRYLHSNQSYFTVIRFIFSAFRYFNQLSAIYFIYYSIQTLDIIQRNFIF